VETGCLCKGRSPGRPRVSHDNIERVREAFQRSPHKQGIGNAKDDGVEGVQYSLLDSV
jgi:hypothetical protein